MNTNKHEPLLPCPFCGDMPLMHIGSSFEVSCTNVLCYANPAVLSSNEEGAVKHWNTRAKSGQCRKGKK